MDPAWTQHGPQHGPVSLSAQNCVDNFPLPLLLSVPLDNGLVTRKTGCHLSLNLINSSTLSHSPPNLFLSVEYHCVSDPGPRNDRCLAANLFAHVTFAIHTVSLCFISPYDVIEHRHADNSSLELFGFAHFVHELLNFLDELQCGESWATIPLEFHRFSVNSVQVSVFLSNQIQLFFPNSI